MEARSSTIYPSPLSSLVNHPLFGDPTSGRMRRNRHSDLSVSHLPIVWVRPRRDDVGIGDWVGSLSPADGVIDNFLFVTRSIIITKTWQ